MGTFLGLGPSIVLTDAEVFQKKADRIELTMAAAEVKEKISKQRTTKTIAPATEGGAKGIDR
jgi:hypothetical protein